MSNMTSESEDKITSGDCMNSPTGDEVSTERNMVGSGSLKKGPWTSAEDAILVDYVNKHGEGNWNAVQKHSGLSRCGKSCRLRWANHLRPDLRKGAFTPEEERRIIELHAKMGNKWARMAVELPGRTDNEIKNFWNTRTKRRQRAGLPIYPPDICLQALNDNTQTQNMVTFPNGDASHAEISPTNNFHIPAVEFKNLELNHDFYPPGGSLLDIPGSSLLLGSACNNGFLFPMAHPLKRVRRSETYPDVIDTYQSFEYNENPSSCLFSGSHALINGNTSSLEPVSWATKLELPSFQHSTLVGSCGAPSSPLPSLESVDTLIQIGHTKSDSPSPRNSGLLEAVLHESRALKMSKSNNNSNASAVPTDSWSQNLQGDEWDPISPLGNSAASVFSEYTPHISGDELQSLETISVKHEAEESGAKQCDNRNHVDYLRPDFLLGSNWFGPTCNKDPLGALLQGHDDSGKWDDDISEICRVPRSR